MGLQRRGNVYLWRSTKRRKTPGYHLSADAEGCATLMALVGELQQGRSLKRPVNLTAPDPMAFQGRLPVTGNENVHGFATLDLTFEPWLFEPGVDLKINEAGAHVVLTFSQVGLPQFLEGLQDISKGRGDWAIHGASQEEQLWFWCCDR